MATVLYKGKTLRMVSGKFMQPGDSRELNPKLAKALEGDPDFVITWHEGEVRPIVIENSVEEAPESEKIQSVMPESIHADITSEPVKEFMKPARVSNEARGNRDQGSR